MFTVAITEKGGAQRRLQFDKNEVTIGRVQGNDIILPKGNVSKRHSRIVLKDGRFIVVDLKSTNGTYVNGRKITSPLVIKPGDKVYIGDFILSVDEAGAAEEESPARGGARTGTADAARRAPPPLRAQSSGYVSDAGTANAPAPAAERFPLDEEPPDDSVPPRPRVTPAGPSGRSSAAPAMPRAERARASVVARMGLASIAAPRPRLTRGPRPGAPIATDFATAFRYVTARLADNFDTDNADPYALENEERWNRAQDVISTTISELLSEELIDAVINRDDLAAAALKEAVTFGTLDSLLSDETVREIAVQGTDVVHADYGQGLTPVGGALFSSQESLFAIARRLLAQAGESLDPNRPIHVTSLQDGTHITVLQPPVAVRGLVIEIRRTAAQPVPAEDLVTRGTLSREMLDLLRNVVQSRRNVLVTGPSGSGVTTVLSALVGLTPEHERIVTVERSPSLAIDRSRSICLSTGGGYTGVSFSDVLQQASRFHADRLVIDGAGPNASYEVVLAAAARREGTFVGLGAHSATDALKLIEVLASSGGRSSTGIAALIGEAFQLVVHLKKHDDGTRRVHSISEVTNKDGVIDTQDLFKADFKATAKSASFLKKER